MRKFILLLLVLPTTVLAQQWTDITLQSQTTPSPAGLFTTFATQPLASLNPSVEIFVCNPARTSCANQGVDIQNFAETSYVNGQFATTNSQIATANGSILVLNNQVSGLGTGLAAANSSINSFNGQLTGINTHLTTLDGQVGSLANQVSSLASSYAGLGAQVTGLNGNVSSLQAQVAQFTTQLNAGIEMASQLAVISAAMKDAMPNPGDRYAIRLNLAGWNNMAAGSISFAARVSDSVRFSMDYGRGQSQNMLSGGVNFSFN